MSKIQSQEELKEKMDKWIAKKTILKGYKREGNPIADQEFDFKNNEVVPLYDYISMKIDYAFAVTDNGYIICFKHNKPYVTAQKENHASNGYYFSNIKTSDGKFKNIKIHRAVAFSFYYAKGSRNKVFEYGNFSFDKIESVEQLQDWEVDHRNGDRHDNRAVNFTILPKTINLFLKDYDKFIMSGDGFISEKKYTEKDYQRKGIDKILHETKEWKLYEELLNLYPDGGIEYIYTSSSMSGDGTMKHNIKHIPLNEKEIDIKQFKEKADKTWIIRHTEQDRRIFLGEETEQDKMEYLPNIKDENDRRYWKFCDLSMEVVSGDNYIENFVSKMIVNLKKIPLNDKLLNRKDNKKWNIDLLYKLINELEELMNEQRANNYPDENFWNRFLKIRDKYVDQGILK